MSEPELLISNIANWYARKDVLITGSCGFMGKVLVEKILRSCPNVRNIYLLIRIKKGLTPKERITKFIESPLFDFIKNRNPCIFDKLIPIESDISKSDLGINKKDRKLLIENVSVVIHIAATVKFDEPLKYAIAMNVIGTQQLIEMSYAMKKLEAFVYVSTAYSNCDVFEIEENVYSPSIDLDELINELKQTNDDNLLDLEKLKQRIVKNKPNLYSATKSLSEFVIQCHKGKLPLAIVRPSIVGSTLKEPVVGWVDNLNGATGITMSIGKGLLHSMRMEVDCIADLVPVDLSINMILAAAWGCTQTKNKQLLVYNYTSGPSNPIKWGSFVRLCQKNYIKYSLTGTVWYPFIYLQANTILHAMLVFFLHIVPAYVVDAVLKISGKQTMMIKIQKQLNAAINAMDYFTTHSWKFKNENVDNLFSSLSAIDKKVFNFDIRCVEWQSYVENYCKGVRLFLLKDPVETLPKARATMKRLKYIHFGFKTMLYIIIAWMIYWIITLFL